MLPKRRKEGNGMSEVLGIVQQIAIGALLLLGCLGLFGLCSSTKEWLGHSRSAHSALI